MGGRFPKEAKHDTVFSGTKAHLKSKSVDFYQLSATYVTQKGRNLIRSKWFKYSTNFSFIKQGRDLYCTEKKRNTGQKQTQQNKKR